MTGRDNVAFRSSEGQFRLVIRNDLLATIQDLCQTSHPLETGGVLIGHYNEELDTAIITRVTGPPLDSQQQPTAFYRGIQGLHEMLRALWPKEEYYLGEWHYHPGSSSEPSGTDVKRMQEIAESHEAKCPEPLLLVVGKNYALTVYAFPRKQGALRLDPIFGQGLPEI